MMAELRLAALLCGACLMGFALLFRATERGRTGLALTQISVLGAAVLVGFFIAARSPEAQALRVLAVTSVGLAPAFVGGLAGAALGWMIDRRRNR